MLIPYQTLRIGQNLVCPEEIAPSDSILAENFDLYYLVFERAAALQRAGVASRVFAPVPASRDPARPNLVSQGIAEVMARVTQMPEPEFIPIRDIEPISRNVAYQILGFLGT